MIKRILSLSLTLCLFSFFFAACAQHTATPEQVLSALTEAEIGLPPGQIYLDGSEKHEPAYLPEDLICSLYGNGELPWQLSLVEDYGIFLSSAQHPCEFASFLCYSRSDTDLVATMCHARLDTLRAHYTGTKFESYTQNARVAVIGKYVLLIISSDAEHALSAVGRVL